MKPIRGRWAAIGLMIWAASLSATNAGRAARADEVRVVELQASNIVYDTVSRKLYAAVPGTGGSHANSITSIDPETGTIGASVYVGSEPGPLALSDNSRYLYVGLRGASAVRRYEIATGKAGLQIPLDANFKPADLAAVPGSPESVLIARINDTFSPAATGFALYDNGKRNADREATNDRVVWGAFAGRWYGYPNRMASYDAHNLTPFPPSSADPLGFDELMYGNVQIADYDNGLLFSNNGKVIDPEARRQVGTLPEIGFSTPTTADIGHGRIYCAVSERDACKLVAFDSTTFAPVGSLLVPQATGGPGKIVRWGSDGLALLSGPRLLLIRSKLVGPKRPTVDLSVASTPLPQTMAPGTTQHYTLTVTNNSDRPATGVYLNDRFSKGVEPLSMIASQGQATASQGAIRADIGTLAPHTHVTVKVELRVAAGDASGSGAGASGEGRRWFHLVVVRGADPDATPANNHAEQEVAIASGSAGTPGPVSGVDLTGVWKKLEQTSTGGGVELQATVSGTFEVRNSGDKTAPATKLRFFLASGPTLDGLATLFEEVAVPELAPGKTFLAELKAPLAPGDDAIGLYVLAFVNATKTVEEANKDNNLFPKQVP